ncbi:hypothetical protein GCM10020229_71790 [Kitasatospora albolonga]|uniref:DUF3040 domain-containing protein n=1 Tax=Kitasatospora albolonga TaxID=68173 RepID=UPI0031E67922
MTHPLNDWEATLADEIERVLAASDPGLNRMLRRRTTRARLWLWRPRALALLVTLAAVLTFASVVTACTVSPWAAVAAAPATLALGAAWRRLGGLCLF